MRSRFIEACFVGLFAAAAWLLWLSPIVSAQGTGSVPAPASSPRDAAPSGGVSTAADAAVPPAAADEPTAPEAGNLADELTSSQVGSLISRFTYVAIIGVLLLCGMGLPLPEEVPILASGVLARTGHLQPWPALAALMFGVLAGDSVMFLLGRRWGSHMLEHRLTRKLLTVERKEKIEAAFQKYGAWIIFVARFLPGIRAPLFLTAGSMRASFWTFLAMDGAAALLSVPISFWVAYYFTDKLKEAARPQSSGAVRHPGDGDCRAAGHPLPVGPPQAGGAGARSGCRPARQTGHRPRQIPS
ncbi:MAG: DedA family protein [Planctomycetaceae bacterium]